MTKKYRVHIKETLAKTVEIEAESLIDAMNKVEKKWVDSEIVLTADDFYGAKMTAASNDGTELTGWKTIL